MVDHWKFLVVMWVHPGLAPKATNSQEPRNWERRPLLTSKMLLLLLTSFPDCTQQVFGWRTSLIDGNVINMLFQTEKARYGKRHSLSNRRFKLLAVNYHTKRNPSQVSWKTTKGRCTKPVYVKQNQTKPSLKTTTALITVHYNRKI